MVAALACVIANPDWEKQEKDDEYFRLVLTITETSKSHPACDDVQPIYVALRKGIRYEVVRFVPVEISFILHN